MEAHSQDERIEPADVSATAEKVLEPAPPVSLWRNSNFLWLWAAQTISGTGSSVTAVALPIIAVVSLNATPQQMGLLGAAAMAPGLLLRLPGAAWADQKLNRVPVMVATHVINGLLMASIPLLWFFGTLNFWMLLLVALLESAVGTIGSVFVAPVIPEVVARGQLVEANGKFSATRGIADISGRSLAGLLISVLSAPLAMLVDAASFFIAAVFTRAVRVPPERRIPARNSLSMRGLTADLKPLSSQGLLRASLSAMAYLSLANGVVTALLVLYMVETLKLPPALVGPIIGAGAIGGVIGGVSVSTIHRLLGTERTIGLSIVLLTLSFLPLPFATPGMFGAFACANYEFVGSFGAALLIITVFSEIPARVPPQTIARVMAAVTLVPEGAALLGSLIGGVLAAAWGLHYTFGASLAFAVVANVVLGLLVLATRRRSRLSAP